MSAKSELLAAYAARRPIAAAMYTRARHVLAGGVGHDLRHFEPMPLYIKNGVGSRKWDVDGNEYVDFLMGNGALLLGHAHPEIVESIREAAGRGTHFGNDHPLHVEWGDWVQKLVPSAERVRFVSSGTEATQLALRLARASTGRSKILRFQGHFHGWHDDVIHGFQPPFDADGSLGVPPNVREHFTSIADGDLSLLEEVLQRDREIAAVIVEPSGASWGRVPIRPEFLQGLRRVTAENHVRLIFDEIVTGFRFSPGGVQELHQIVPDLTCLAKILAGGMPGGAVVGRADVMTHFDITGDAHHDRHARVHHQGTFNGSPISAAAGIVMLQHVATGQPTEHANRMAAKLRNDWNAILERHGIAGYAYGPSSTFHVYFETNENRLRSGSQRQDLHTNDATLLKSMPKPLIDQYQRHLRYRGVDVMSSTGGLLSSAHNDADIEYATDAFEKTVLALRDEGLVHVLN